MSEHYDFHYQPTGSGAISGQQVLQQTEDAINELGDYVNDNVGGAMDVAQQALETAQNAEQDAQTALNTANSFSGAIQSAQQDASTALSTAQTAQTTASNANNTAIQAQQDASSAVTTANNASGQVSTLSGTVTTLGQRVTTAEGNIGQNTSDITALTTRVGTAEGNITTLQNDVSIAQGNASSAMATAGTVKQQAFVFRYSSTALVASSTNSNTLLDNTDNLKVGDKVIDSDGVLFSITAIDSVNSTFTIGTALIDLAQDSDVVHKSGDETVGGQKTFSDDLLIYNSDDTQTPKGLTIRNAQWVMGESGGTTVSNINFVDKNSAIPASIIASKGVSGQSFLRFSVRTKDSQNNTYAEEIYYNVDTSGSVSFRSWHDNIISLGTSAYKWKGVYATNYYYGSNNVEFSTKFVTTDTAQTISGGKTFSSNVNVYNSDTSASTPNLTISSSKIQVGDTSNSDSFGINFNAGLSYIASISAAKDTSGTQNLMLGIRTKDNSNNFITSRIRLRLFANGNSFFEPDTNNTVSLGSSSYKFKDVQTYKVNNLEPSSLSLPDIDNRIDISSYITNLSNVRNEYTPSVNGWICIKSANATKISILDSGTNIGNTSISNTATYLTVMTPVVANRKVLIIVMCTSLEFAYFIPCQGNV